MVLQAARRQQAAVAAVAEAAVLGVAVLMDTAPHPMRAAWAGRALPAADMVLAEQESQVVQAATVLLVAPAAVVVVVVVKTLKLAAKAVMVLLVLNLL
jgi:hypothetical protein